MMLVTNAALAEDVLAHLIEKTDTDMDALLKEGVSAELIDMLRHRTVRDLREVAARPEHLGIRIVVDERKIIGSFMQLDARRNDAEQFEYFVRNGGSPKVGARLFNKLEDDVRQAIHIFGKKASLRDTMPPEAMRTEIHEAWARIKADAKETGMLGFRKNLREVHDLFPDYTIHALLKVLSEFIEGSGRQMEFVNSEIGTLR